MNFMKGVRTVIVLGMLTGGCAGFGDHHSALAPTLPPAPETVALTGTWRGSFTQVGAGDTGQIQGNVVLQVKDDGTYSGTWTTQLVSGSSRGSKMDTTGRAAATGNAVAFSEASGSAFTLKHVGHKLYGMRKDPASGRTIAVQLEKVPATN